MSTPDKGDRVVRNYEREKVLEKTIREAILELERTKTAFKSRRIKEVREKLAASLEG